MKILMASIDHELATLEQREKFSFTKHAMESIYEGLKAREDINGSVVISTCNRTEIYLSCNDDFSKDPFKVLCQVAHIDSEEYEGIYTVLEDREVTTHLCEVASGVKSQIWGDGQIITQVKNSIAMSRELKACDSALEVLFRIAITAGKKVRSQIKYSSLDDSSAKKAVLIVNRLGENQNVLVIGNGEIGRLVASNLVKSKHRATMTLRQYKTGQNIIPAGVESINYMDRYEFMNNVDVVISATLSPHYTIDLEIFEEKVTKHPKLFIDLAVPRDIDPRVGEFSDVKYYNVDDISRNEVEENHSKQLEEVQAIIERYINDFDHWVEYKNKAQAEAKNEAMA